VRASVGLAAKEKLELTGAIASDLLARKHTAVLKRFKLFDRDAEQNLICKQGLKQISKSLLSA
jgi:hypothetical protein